jgi:hypothetical protein
MQEITDFEWDRFVVYNVGSSNSEISKLLGIDYEDPVDLMYGMVFAYKDKIVYSENLPYNPEEPNKLWISFDNKPSEPNCLLFSKENDLFKGLKEKIDGVNYNQLLPNK